GPRPSGRFLGSTERNPRARPAERRLARLDLLAVRAGYGPGLGDNRHPQLRARRHVHVLGVRRPPRHQRDRAAVPRRRARRRARRGGHRCSDPAAGVPADPQAVEEPARRGDAHPDWRHRGRRHPARHRPAPDPVQPVRLPLQLRGRGPGNLRPAAVHHVGRRHRGRPGYRDRAHGLGAPVPPGPRPPGHRGRRGDSCRDGGQSHPAGVRHHGHGRGPRGPGGCPADLPARRHRPRDRGPAAHQGVRDHRAGRPRFDGRHRHRRVCAGRRGDPGVEPQLRDLGGRRVVRSHLPDPARPAAGPAGPQGGAPHMSDWYSMNVVLIQTTLTTLLLALSIQVPIRFGVFSFAGVGAFGIGGYTAAIAMVPLGWTTWPSVALGAVISGIVVFALGLLVQRLTGLYMGMATIAFTLIISVLAVNGGELTGGAGGLYGALGEIDTGHILAILAVVVAVLVWTETKGMGRRIDTVREDPELANSVGIDVVKYRLASF